jgi:hypothetical protein
MTHFNPDSHLTYDELLRAMTDPSDLDTARRAHLTSCQRCRRQTEDMTYRYRRLGQMAKQMAPEPRQAFRVPAHNAAIGRWRFRPGVALGVLGVMIFIFTLSLPRFTGNSHPPAPVVALNFEDDDRLLEEIDTLVEDALPEAYQQLAAVSDNRSVEDLDEFVDWMVPAPEEDDDVVALPVTSARETRQKSLLRSDLAVLYEEGIV